jgi:hypothetical protein
MTLLSGAIGAGLPGFQLTGRDIDLIRAVYDYRFLHINHLSALVNRSYKKVHGRLFKLVQNHFLARIEFRFQKHIYVIGPEGIDVLVEQGIASRELVECRLRHQELKELFLKHQLMLIDLRCILELACRGTSVRLATWSEGKDLWDRVVTWVDRERLELPVCPDAFLVLEDGSRPEGRNRLNFFLEADRSTSTHKRFQQKLIAYHQYLEDGRHTGKYGIKSFRVVTFTLTEQRAHALSAAAREVLPEHACRHFLFASVQGLSITDPKPILSDIFVGPRGEACPEAKLSLVPTRGE